MSTYIGIFPDTNDINNKIELNKDYYNAIVNIGAIPIILPYADQVKLKDVLQIVDGVLLTGGDDIDPAFIDEEPLRSLGKVNPERDIRELSIARYCLEEEIPLLGICKGMQVMGIACGGQLYQDIYSQRTTHTIQHQQKAPSWYGWHEIQLEQDTNLYGIIQKTSVRVNSFHHQGMKACGELLKVCARSKDNLIEAIEHPEHPFYIGVQWHPERMFLKSSEQQQLFKAFFKCAKNYRRNRDGS
ncbi:gamma-glutamyl-gamma-aminobutyrate hydrolase family protein [Vallitalea okinawensis]|uniref:gamma-glutamyl-gamma-aminobutyrate hydrolase family protein n=1 Tax=Vallitalea okinawensis TaxID=2078660 RepID=UPI000CFCB53B|nr:gamma-glutamyl-gamma-aminobutyrate hydrolase family protein [Vallitalea okinawensis]